jgi:acyl dehydratase
VTLQRSLTLSGDLLRAYSRRGNFHSDAAEADRLGLPGLVAQGMQVAAPAYSALLDAWGDDFLAHGSLDLKFVGMVLEGETVLAGVEVDGETATITVTNATRGATVAVGTAARDR